MLVLDQLEQGGLHLLDLRDLGQDELPMLACDSTTNWPQPSSRSISPCENETSLILISGKSRPDRDRMPSAQPGGGGW